MCERDRLNGLVERLFGLRFGHGGNGERGIGDCAELSATGE